MSINGALQIGRSGLVAAQAGIQVAGNNMANAATEGYTRQILHISPSRGEQVGRGQFIGGGVRIDDITRAIDTALQGRYRDALSNEHEAHISQRFLTALETIQNELTDNDLSTLLSEFFNAFSELANNPEDNAVRSVLLQQATALTDRMGQMRADYGRLRDEANRDLGASVDQANDIMQRLSLVNMQIAQAENGAGQANALRDQRDQLVNELSKLMDVSTVEQENGSVDVFVGSTPVVLAGETRGLHLRLESQGGEVVATVRLDADETALDIGSGRIGALLEQRNGPVQDAVEALDTFASQLIHQVNRIHSQGQGQHGFDAVTGSYSVADTAVNLNHVDADLPFRIENGSFFLHVTHAETGTRTTHQINVDGDAMSLADLVDEINSVVGVPNATAGIDASGRFTLSAAAGFELSFSDDSSGALAALGVNTFFSGRNASDVAVNQVLRDDPSMLAAGSGHIDGSNATAIAIANLQDAPLAELNDRSLREFWVENVNRVAVGAAAANTAVAATRLVRESVAAQVSAVSGVSLDEEAINLLQFQRQFQAAARFISVIDETMQILLSLA